MSVAAALFLGVMLGGPAAVLLSGSHPVSGDWRSASRAPTGLAPVPARSPEAVVQVYSARAFEWRGAFAVHTWIAAKPKGAARYRRYEAIGWRAQDGRSPIAVEHGTPDSQWYGAQPRRLADLRGAAAERAIAQLDRAVASYPFAQRYRAWPGPNSNTFIAYLLRRSPALDVPMAALGIGKDYLDGFVAPAPSNTGISVAAWGVLGLNLGIAEGLELVVLGQTVGIDVTRPALKLPGLGRIGMARPAPAALPPTPRGASSAD